MSKTVIVFCAERRNKSNTREIIRNLYKNSPVNVIYTGAGESNWEIIEPNINRIIKLPLGFNSLNWNRNTFNREMTSLLGNRKVDLFVFEFCPLGSLFHNSGCKSASGSLRSNSFNTNIVNVLRKYAKNNARIATAWPDPSNKLVYNRNLVVPSYRGTVRSFKFRN